MHVLMMATLFFAAQAKTALPSGVDAKKAIRALRVEYKSEFKKKTKSGKATLAKKLTNKSAGTKDKTKSYVMLTEAIRLATEAGDVDVAIDAIDILDSEYKVKPIELKMDALRAIKRISRTPVAIDNVTHGYFDLVDAAMDADDFKAALKAAKEALSLARRAKYDDYIQRALKLTRGIPKWKRSYAPVKAAKAQLLSKPNNKFANLIVGTYLCFNQGRWKEGTTLLAKGSHPGLKKAGELEVKKTYGALSKIRTGDAWWDYSTNARDANYKKASASRALYWYEQALSVLTGDQHTKLKIRIMQAKDVIGD